ncbi:cbdbA26 protein [Chitinispirillum alkaliphilum]|nr:cbdbA26 protein [Chitinispirillum alkaliphilum]
MNRTPNWQITLAIVLTALAIFFYTVHFYIFRDFHHIGIYFLGDIAFVFIEVLLVALVLHRLLHHREQKALRDRLHMLTGAFFSEIGGELLGKLAEFDPNSENISSHLTTPQEWSEREFLNIRNIAVQHKSDISSKKSDLDNVKQLLAKNKWFILNLLQNENLLKDESFTNLLWAVYHLTGELEHRSDLKEMTDEEFRNLDGDIKRVYHLLLVGWMDYMNHLKKEYPFLFSLTSRKNPFGDDKSSVEIK